MWWLPTMRTKNPLKKSASGKADAYDALCAINHGFEDVIANLDKLLMLDLFHGRPQRGFLKSCQLAVEETRAWASFEITDVLRGCEENDWARFGRSRMPMEMLRGVNVTTSSIISISVRSA